jgi:hypothetical protein
MTSKRLCCCIPDQSKIDERCHNYATYQIWNGHNPTPDDYTESCAEHLEEMLDDSSRFEVLRIVAPSGPAYDYETIDGKWWAYLNGKPCYPLTDEESAEIIWGESENGDTHPIMRMTKCQNQATSS